MGSSPHCFAAVRVKLYIKIPQIVGCVKRFDHKFVKTFYERKGVMPMNLGRKEDLLHGDH
mgnify:CR=1 FL=1